MQLVGGENKHFEANLASDTKKGLLDMKYRDLVPALDQVSTTHT